MQTEMGLWILLLFLSHILISIGLTISQPDFLYHFCIESSGNYTSNSIYQTNLNTLLSSLSSNTDEYGFYSSSVGENPDTVYATVLCRGDVDVDMCRGCIDNSTSKLTQDCPNNMVAIGWYEFCMLRYSNESMTGIMTESPTSFVWNVANVSSMDQFNQALRTMLDSLGGQAASGGSLRKYASVKATAPDFQTLYGLMQCTPDLSKQDCSNCLQAATADIPECCEGKTGGSVLKPSCNLRFEIVPFFGETPADAPPPAPQANAPPPPANAPPPGKASNTTQTIVIIVVSTSISIVLFIVCICIFFRKRKQKQPEQNIEGGDEIGTMESLQYDFETISIATNNFSDSNQLGRGGFGVVFKGTLPNGQEIAVKRLSEDSGQGEPEFKNEVMLVARLQHRNLVRLLGFCLDGTERLLVYEFVTNLSLDHFLSDPIKRARLDWDTRYKIIRGVARGLLYLHEDSRLRIIHRDLKASNILFDEEMNPKISDFGMARLFVLDETQGNTSRIVGT